jgi:ABC-type sugar transport system ATPase subunit
MLGDWRIKSAGIDALPDSLSGGNQQKVVVAKWMATNPRVLLLDEPTKGVDVGAKFEIHDMIRQQARAGLAVLVVSSDLPEILALADRILVMKEGELQGELDGASATEESVMRLATHAAVNA